MLQNMVSGVVVLRSAGISPADLLAKVRRHLKDFLPNTFSNVTSAIKKQERLMTVELWRKVERQKGIRRRRHVVYCWTSCLMRITKQEAFNSLVIGLD